MIRGDLYKGILSLGQELMTEILTADLQIWQQQNTYIISYTDHQMFLDLRTPQTEPTGTLYGSWGEY